MSGNLKLWACFIVPFTLGLCVFIYTNSVYLLILPPALLFAIYQIAVYVRNTTETRIQRQVDASQLSTALIKTQMFSDYAESIGDEMLARTEEKSKAALDLVSISHSVTENQMKSRVRIKQRQAQHDIDTVTSQEDELTENCRQEAKIMTSVMQAKAQNDIYAHKIQHRQSVQQASKELRSTKEQLKRQLEESQRESARIRSSWKPN